MKKYLLIAIAILLFQTGDAQKNENEFEAEAKIILLNNDTLYGTTIIDRAYKWNDFKGSDIDRVFFFKETGKPNSAKFRPKNSNGFLIKTSDSLWATFISSGTLDNFEDERGEFTGKVFLLKIVEGEMSLYHSYHADRHRTKDGSSFWKPDNITKVLYKKGALKIYHSEIYEAWQSKLLKFVSDCPELAAKLKAVKCKGWSFLQIAEYYNSNCK